MQNEVPPHLRPTAEREAPETLPTLRGLLKVLERYRSDRCCLVRGPEGSRQLQLFMVLASAAAMRAIGPGLQEILRRHPNLHAGDESPLLKLDEPVRGLQDWMFERGQTWRWMEVAPEPCPLGTFKPVAVVLSGNAVCELAARVLNRNQCPCDLRRLPVKK